VEIIINPQAPLPIYAQIVQQFKDIILSGRSPAGTAMPSVRGLADRLEINSLTIQKAYKQLESEGLIEIRKGVGATVCEVETMGARDSLKIIESQLNAVIAKAKTLGFEKSDFDQLAQKIWEKK
jgi:GntR family transcriptional regulator